MEEQVEMGQLDYRITEYGGKKIVQGFVKFRNEIIEIEQVGCSVESNIGSRTVIVLKTYEKLT